MDFEGLFAIAAIFVILPGIVFHYVTQWKRSGSLSLQDENLLDELHDLARRLDDRMATIERIVAADHPDFRRPQTERVADDYSDTHVFDQLAERRERQPRG